MGIFTKKTKQDETDKAIEKTAKIEDVVKQKDSGMKDLYKEDVKKMEIKGEIKSVKKQNNAYRVLIKPLITEKAAELGSLTKYVFMVNLNANKIEVAKAIEEVYGLKPTSVNIIKTQGKNVNRGRQVGRRKDWKKAIVTLPKGKSINVYEGV